ncbi:MAG TPA: hypothetical protein PK639_00530 [Candidatus Woesebacteria bacterium]|nr:hypothetical protein [Candidatus Woesebacteria bacterium]
MVSRHDSTFLELPFNRQVSAIMHIDLNSCFARIEQQANPLYRDRPLVVAAYASARGCVLAPSVEAKKLGIKVGTRVQDAKLICPEVIVIETDPDKYRFVHRQLKNLLSQYTADLVPKSIDEFTLNFLRYPGLKLGLKNVGAEIKQRIKDEIGDWLTVSIGIGPNRFLAKTASNLKKPDGLEEINYQNYQTVYQNLKLLDLCGINTKFAARLNAGGIHTVTDLYQASIYQLKSVFHSITGYYWYLRLRGWEIDDVEFSKKSFGHMYSLPTHYSAPSDLSPILSKLVEKMAFRLRRSGYTAKGVHLGILYTDYSFWHQAKTVKNTSLFSTKDLYSLAYRILLSSPFTKPVANLSVSCFDLCKNNVNQLNLFSSVPKSLSLTQALDDINSRYGRFVITPAKMISASSLIPDRIGFGSTDDVY